VLLLVTLGIDPQTDAFAFVQRDDPGFDDRQARALISMISFRWHHAVNITFLDHSTVSHEATRSFNDSVTVTIPPGNAQGLSHHRNQPCRLNDCQRTLIVSDPVAQASPRWTTVVVRSVICAVVLVGVGCDSGQTGPQEYTEAEAKAQLDELLARFPVPPPDTPEQIREKEAKVEATLPQVYELLEAAKTDPTKVDAAVELSMSQLTLVPGHRAAKVAYGKAQLASFFAKEATDPHNMAIAIRSACLEIDRLRENFEDLSEDEVQLCQEVYFNRARLEGYYPHGSDTLEIFKDSIGKLVSLGFRDAERLKAEPRFEYFFTDPNFAPVLEAAIKQIEASAEDDRSK